MLPVHPGLCPGLFTGKPFRLLKALRNYLIREEAQLPLSLVASAEVENFNNALDSGSNNASWVQDIYSNSAFGF